MPEIRVVHPHTLPVDQVPARLRGFDELLRKYGVHLAWHGTRADIRGVPGVGGHVAVRPAEVEVVVSLSRMITLMGLDPTRLEQTVRRRLTQALSPDAP